VELQDIKYKTTQSGSFFVVPIKSGGIEDNKVPSNSEHLLSIKSSTYSFLNAFSAISSIMTEKYECQKNLNSNHQNEYEYKNFYVSSTTEMTQEGQGIW